MVTQLGRFPDPFQKPSKFFDLLTNQRNIAINNYLTL